MDIVGHRTPDFCVRCARLIEVTWMTAGDPAPPREGDFTMCLSCGELMRFDEACKVRRTTCEDVEELSEDERRTISARQKQIWKRGPLRHPKLDVQ